MFSYWNIEYWVDVAKHSYISRAGVSIHIHIGVRISGVLDVNVAPQSDDLKTQALCWCASRPNVI